MATTYSLILRECAEPARGPVASFLGRAFSLKDATCTTIAGSAPIALLSDLSVEEAAALSLVISGLQQSGVVIEFSTETNDDLPKIDWPKRPPVFKREIADYVADYKLGVLCPDCGKDHPLLFLLLGRLRGAGKNAGSASSGLRPPTIANEYKGSQLPEITPFYNQVLPPAAANGAKSSQSGPRPAARSQAPAPAQAPASNTTAGEDAVNRLNELFPDEDTGGIIPPNNDITSILNRLLPDEDSGVTEAANGSPSANPVMAASGFSLFLAKIGDEARRLKVVPLLQELAKISKDEADSLSKKVIIPVLKGVSKDEAEAAKQRFAKIGILARIKGAETVS